MYASNSHDIHDMDASQKSISWIVKQSLLNYDFFVEKYVFNYFVRFFVYFSWENAKAFSPSWHHSFIQLLKCCSLYGLHLNSVVSTAMLHTTKVERGIVLLMKSTLAEMCSFKKALTFLFYYIYNEWFFCLTKLSQSKHEFVLFF